jgi:diguanylate cyclase (GGDEF)-like protein/PAS domain S-box-containing protein
MNRAQTESLYQSDSCNFPGDIAGAAIQALDHYIEPVYWVDRDGRLVYVNAAACAMLGYSSEQLRALNLLDCDPTLSSGDWPDMFDKLVRGELTRLESVHRCRQGNELYVELSFSVIEVAEQVLICVFAKDVSDRHREARHMEELRFTVENASDAIYLYNKDGSIYYANRSACEALGYTLEELTKKNIGDIDIDFSLADHKRLWDHPNLRNLSPIEKYHRRKDGTLYPVEITANKTEFEGSEYAAAFVRDITERKHALRELEQLHFAVDNSYDPIYFYNARGEITYANQSACRMLGYGLEELTRLTVFDIDPHMTKDLWDRGFDLVKNGVAQTIESTNRRKDGSCFQVEVTATNMSFAGQDFGCSVNRDITERKEIERTLLRIQFAIDSAGDAIFFTNPHGQIVYANQTACNNLGYSRKELLRLTVRDIDPGLKAGDWDNDDLWDSIADGASHTFEARHRRRDGSIFPVEVKATVMDFEHQQISCSVVRDISDWVEAQTALRDSEERFRVIADTSPVALIICREADGAVLYSNKQASALFAKESCEISCSTFYSLIDDVETGNRIKEIFAFGTSIHGREFKLNRETQDSLWVSLSAKSIELQGEQVICSALLDITEAHQLSEQLSYHATYDSLTGLVNRREFEDRLGKVIKRAKKNASENALCYLDLDQFKVINDTCGHIAGDELLRQLGNALHAHIRKHDTLARLGGDEFAVLIEDCNVEEATRVANAIRQAIQEFRFVWQGNRFNIGVSIGLVSIGISGETTTDVLRRADTACYTAKEKGRNRIHVSHLNDEELEQRHGEMQWVARINSALEKNHLQLWAQKIVAINPTEQHAEHFELLLRMEDEAGRTIPPGAFLPAAERYNIASRIDRWTTSAAFTWLADNPELVDRLALCSMNLSGQSLSDEDFLREIVSHIDELKIPAYKLCFEITETAAIANLSAATRFMTTLKERGCSFALDDFGSGLSSFAYLKNLPVDYLKIDGLFVKDILVDPIDLAMVKSINDVGHVMGKKTIAEFVENDEILAQLRNVGVDYAQGYGISRPMPLSEAFALADVIL